MSDSPIYKSKIENELLKRGAEFVDKGEPQRAIALLLEALKVNTESEVIVGCLVYLYKQIGHFENAKTYTQKLFDIQGNLLNSSLVDLPDEHDFDFLHTQLHEISEAEYSFEAPITKPTEPRERLSSKGIKPLQPDEGNVKSNVIVKNKFRHLLDEKEQKDNFIESESTNIKSDNETNSKVEIDNQGDWLNTVNVNYSYSSSGYEAIEPNSEAIKKTNKDPFIAIQCSSVSCDVENLTTSARNDSEVSSLNESIPDEAFELSLAEYSEYEDIYEVNDLEWVADELTTDAEQEDGLAFFGDIELPSFTESEADEELSFYDYWDDAFEDQVDEDSDEEIGVLGNTLTIEERARLVAVEFVLEFNWDNSSLPFLIEAFSSRGWSNIRKAFEREVAAGASFEELLLAFEVKKLWQDSSRYWITFNKANGFGESTDATYRNCSWSQALRLIRVFESIPTYQEIYDFLEYEFEVWFGHAVFRKFFPAFTKYLFNYRLHERNIPHFIDGFRTPDECESGDAMWSYYTHSDEMAILRELGVDLMSRNVPKTTFVSDKYTFSYLLEYWRSTTPESERGKYNEK